MINNYDEFNNEKVGNNEEAKLKKKRINDLKRQKLLVKIEQFFKQKEQVQNYKYSIQYCTCSYTCI